jgi:glycosyltransferase involved in cell wall biosynthesis
MFRPAPERRPVDPPYLLSVGQWDIHKGYEEAFELISLMAEKGWPHRLKVVGHNPPWTQSIVDSLLSRCGHPERVDLLGRVDLATLVDMYQDASAVVVTSRYEGFGFPALESMACGTPLVAFRNSALPEVIDDGGVLVTDGDVAGMGAEVDRLLGDQSRSRELSRRGLLRSRTFSWATVAQRHRDIYLEAVEVWQRDVANGGKGRDRR